MLNFISFAQAPSPEAAASTAGVPPMLARGELAAAKSVLATAVRRFSAWRELRLSLAALCAAVGDNARALAHLRQLNKQEPAWIPAWWAAGCVQQTQHDTGMAVICLEKARELWLLATGEEMAAQAIAYPALNFAALLTDYSVALRADKQLDAALVAAQQAWHSESTGRQGKKQEKTLLAYVAATRLSEQYALARAALNEFFAMHKQAERAPEHNTIAAAVYVESAMLAMGEHDSSTALAHFAAALARDDQDASTWALYGGTLHRLGRLAEAQSAYTHAVGLAPGNEHAALCLAMCHDQQGDTTQARRILHATIDRLPTPSTALLFYACELAQSAQDFADAQAWRQRAEKEMIRQRPHLGWLPTENADEFPEVVMLFNYCGRSGSLFLHSLLDHHPQILTTPGVLMAGFFASGVWESLCPPFADKHWRSTLIARFCHTYAVLFDGDCERAVPGTPYGADAKKIGAEMGLTQLGEQGDTVLRVDRELFSQIMNEALATRQAISAAAFFHLVHQAYDTVVQVRDGLDLASARQAAARKKILLYHIHSPNWDMLSASLLALHNNRCRILNIVRQPLQALESWMKLAFVKQDSAAALWTQWESVIDRVRSVVNNPALLYGNDFASATTVRLEDLKQHSDATLNALCTWLGIDDRECLRHETFAGLPYRAPSSTPVVGFSSANLRRASTFSERDRRCLNFILLPIALRYRYRTIDPAEMRRELAFCRREINERQLMDWEIPFSNAFAEQQGDTSQSADMRYPLHQVMVNFFRQRELFFQGVQSVQDVQRDLAAENAAPQPEQQRLAQNHSDGLATVMELLFPLLTIEG